MERHFKTTRPSLYKKKKYQDVSERVSPRCFNIPVTFLLRLPGEEPWTNMQSWGSRKQLWWPAARATCCTNKRSYNSKHRNLLKVRDRWSPEVGTRCLARWLVKVCLLFPRCTVNQIETLGRLCFSWHARILKVLTQAGPLSRPHTRQRQTPGKLRLVHTLLCLWVWVWESTAGYTECVPQSQDLLHWH